MEGTPPQLRVIGAATKRFARCLLAIGENRVELLMTEVQEEREHLLHTLILALAAAGFSLLVAVSLTLAIVVWAWDRAPVAALLGLAVLYAAAAAILYRKLQLRQRNRQALSATLDQLKKDRACLEKLLG